MKNAFSAALIALTSVACAAPSRAQPVRLGIAGDSISNEYFEFAFNYAKSWPQLLVDGRQIDIGPTAAQAGHGDWGDLRGWGYQNNYARGGASTDALILEGSPASLADAVLTRGVTYVVICASGNDIAPWNSYFYIDFYEGQWTQRRLDAFADASAGNIREAVQTVRASGAHVVLVNMPDFGSTPQVQNHYTDPAGRTRATAVLHRINNGIRLVARDYQIPLVDLYSLYSAVYGPADQPRELLDVGGVSVGVSQSGDADNPLTGFVFDGLHPSTIVQAIIANTIITALNTGYHTTIPTFTEAEILGFVGVAAQQEGQLPGQIGPYGQYVRTSFDCAADFNSDGQLTSQDIFDFINAWLGASPSSDFDHSGTLDATDMFGFLNAWMGGGC
jgi:lysophospholipase L1-like esterase